MNWYDTDENGPYIASAGWSDRCERPLYVKYRIESWEQFEGFSILRKWTYGLYDLTEDEKREIEDFMQEAIGC